MMRMDRNKLIGAACLLGAAFTASAGDATDVERALMERRHGLWHTASMVYGNPAMNQWRMEHGLTEVDVAADMRRDHGVVNPGAGNRSDFFSGGAETYTKYRSSTLWGRGRYINGAVKNMVWNETADYHIVYPYILADSVGGDMKREQYDFSGGYAACNDRWAWGAELSYLATLEYREVDPRPRNVVGQLDVAAGVAYRVLGDYYAGVSLRLRKYKQTNEVEFKSEMGVDKIFHLTGMGTHYYRFAGTGLSTYYDGYRYGASAEFYPRTGHGAFLSCGVSRFSFDNILSDLNKLPLASVWHNAVDAQAGWLNPGERHDWGVSASVSAYRRHGSENIFGDAASSVYPQIGSIAMYADNYVALSGCGQWGMKFNAVNRIGATLGVGWERRTVAYVEPWRYSQSGGVDVECGVTGDFSFPGGWMLDAGCSLGVRMPSGHCRIQLNGTDDAEMSGPVGIELRNHSLASMRSVNPAAGITIGHSIAGRYFLQLGLQWHHTSYADHTTVDNLSTNLGLYF